MDGAVDDHPPKRPREPEPEECCGSGCVPCVYDRFWDALGRYEEALAQWRQRNPNREP